MKPEQRLLHYSSNQQTSFMIRYSNYARHRSQQQLIQTEPITKCQQGLENNGSAHLRCVSKPRQTLLVEACVTLPVEMVLGRRLSSSF
ncbi:hypothetical protein V2G26_010507 [Clonostachys chloroleuca]